MTLQSLISMRTTIQWLHITLHLTVLFTTNVNNNFSSNSDVNVSVGMIIIKNTITDANLPSLSNSYTGPLYIVIDYRQIFQPVKLHPMNIDKLIH